MLLAFHIIFGTYGFWLPNDPRGSWSKFVGSWELFRYGKPVRIETPESTACVPHDHQLRQDAKTALHYPLVQFSGVQALSVAKGIELASEEANYTIYAFSILPEHIHMVVGRHPRPILQILSHLKAKATRRLKDDGLWSESGRPIWAKGCWKVFLDRPFEIMRAIQYVEENPEKEG